MSEYQMETVKVKASHPSQGDYVLVNKSDFEKGGYELYEEAQEVKKKK